MKVIVTGTGTGVGKTHFSRGLARLWTADGSVSALKPFETGVERYPADARDLAAACYCEELDLENLPGFYRVRPPLAPYAATLMGDRPPDLDEVQAAILEQAGIAERTLVEGAGGLRVPLTRDVDFAAFAKRLDWPVICVAKDGLGVLSHVLTFHDSAAQAGLNVIATVLTRHGQDELSQSTNADILNERVGPVFVMGHCERNKTQDLADAVEASGITSVLR